MNQNSIKELPKLRNENYANIFKVYQDKDNRYFYNLLQTVVIPSNLPIGYYDNYSVVYGDTWPFISYKVYDTPNLWWVIINTNNIQNPTAQLEPGTQLKILKSQYVSLILNEIKTQK
jgi:nucleoid-associated protein YgaU